jgi:hypothetical protein
MFLLLSPVLLSIVVISVWASARCAGIYARVALVSVLGRTIAHVNGSSVKRETGGAKSGRVKLKMWTGIEFAGVTWTLTHGRQSSWIDQLMS